MDFACALRQSKTLNYSVCSSSGCLNQRSRCRTQIYKVLGDTAARRRKKELSAAALNLALLAPRRGLLLPSPQRSCRGPAWLQCQSNDSVAYVDGESKDVEITGGSLEDGLEGKPGNGPGSIAKLNGAGDEEKDYSQVEELTELLQKAIKDLEVARLNNTMFEEKAQSISESAIALKDEAESAWREVTSAVSTVHEIIGEETAAKEEVQKATMALSMAEARLHLATEAVDLLKDEMGSAEATEKSDEKEALTAAEEETKSCKDNLKSCEAALRRIQAKKAELQKEVDRLSEIAEKMQLNALKAEEDVANIMLLAEQAMAFELKAAQCVNDAELALRKAEKASTSVDSVDQQVPSSQEQLTNEESHVADGVIIDIKDDTTNGRDEVLVGDNVAGGELNGKNIDAFESFDDTHDKENGKFTSDLNKDADIEVEKPQNVSQTKKPEIQQDFKKDSPLNTPKSLLKKSSRFFSASFFSFKVDGEEFTSSSSVFHGLIASARKQAPKLVVGVLLLGMGAMLAIVLITITAFFNSWSQVNIGLLLPLSPISNSVEVAPHWTSSGMLCLEHDPSPPPQVRLAIATWASMVRVAGTAPPLTQIKDLVKELDILLSSIEKEGGFRDACTVFQKSSVVALEEDLENIFEMSRRCKTKLVERLLTIQHLQNKMLQGLEYFSKQSSESQPKSVFKWAKDLPDFHCVESRSQPVPMLNRSIEPSSSVLSSPSHLNGVQFNSKKTSGSVAIPVNQATQLRSKQYSSTMETATVSKQSGMQLESPTIGQTFSEVSSIISPTRNKLISRNQAIEQLNLKNAGGPTEALLRSNKQPTTFPHSQPAISNGSNISPLALTLAGPSTSQNTDWLDGMENNNQQTEFLNTLSQESVSIAPIPISSTSAISSTVSLPFSPSVSPNSLPTVSDGVSQAALVSPATSAASDQSAFSSGLLPSQNSPTSTYSPFKSSELKPFTLQSVGVSCATKPTQAEAHPSVDPVSQSEFSSKLEPAVSMAPVKEVSAGLFSKKEPNLLPINTSTTSIVLSTQHELPSTIAPTTIASMNEKDEVVDINSSLEDEMEEEAPDTSVLNLGSFGGFGLGSNPPSATKPNPFGGSLFGTTASSATFQFSHITLPGELFRPPSLNLPSAQQVQQTRAVHSCNTSGGFSGFGQAAQLGSGQQALGSVLGSFGQSRQIGSGMAGFGVAGFSAPANSGGFASAGGFANAATGSGFSIASSGGGFAGTPNVGGFAAVASSGGGFAAAAAGGGFAAASGSGGFAAAFSAGGGFGGAGQGGGFATSSPAAGGFGGAGPSGGFAGSTSANGFGAFNSSRGGGFSAFGSSNSTGTGRPPAALLNQMRK